MKKLSGKLYVLEGIDHVGKTTLINKLVNKLNNEGITCSTYSFPGKEKGTLGNIVYDMHHHQSKYFSETLNNISLQMLHVASHIDNIIRRIIPDLQNGKIVILDRFYWSTYAYGLAADIDKQMMDSIIAPEIKLLSNLPLQQVFLIHRKGIPNDYPSEYFNRVMDFYNKLAKKHQAKGECTVIENDGTIDEAVEAIISIINKCNINKRQELNNSPIIYEKHYVKTTKVYDAYWKFAAERQEVFFNRLEGKSKPWTQDLIINKYKFTNSYRASDRVSQYLIRNVIYSGNYNEEDTLFRIILYKLFNKIDTWEYLENKLGDISYHNYQFDVYDNILCDLLDKKVKIYSAAYIMPSGINAYGYERKHRNNLKLLENMMKDKVPMKVGKLQNLSDLYGLLLSYPSIGKFLAYQYAIDINYSNLCEFDEMSFVVAGPGAKRGIAKCFSNRGNYSDEDIIRLMAEQQEQEFKERNIKFRSLWGRRLQLIDCQNIFCETDKYARVAFPDIQIADKEMRIKQTFRPNKEIINYFYPPKWNINQHITKG